MLRLLADGLSHREVAARLVISPKTELYILYRRAHRQLVDGGITVGPSYVNEYCTRLTWSARR